MESIKLLLIGVVQGITELLPVSSTGHILVLGKALGIEKFSSSLLILFHLGTTVAILIFFCKELFKGFFTKEKWSFYLKVLVASIPVAFVGLLFEGIVSKRLRAIWIIAVSLIVWGVVMIILEKKQQKKTGDIKELEKITWKQAIVVGFAQVVALIPGTSRSGITTIAGMTAGLEKYLALNFSFILSIPVLLGSFILLLRENPIKETILSTGMSSTLGGFAIIFSSTLLFGLITLFILKKVQKKNWLSVFGIYRILLGILLLIIFY